MQLMRNLYLGGDQHTFKQKIIEAKLALDYEKVHAASTPSSPSYLNSVPYGTVGGPDRDRRAGGRADLLRQARLAAEPRSSPRCSPACRRRPPSTTRFPTPRPRASGATRCSRRWPNCTTSAPHEAAAAERAPLEVHLGHYYSAAPRGLLLRIRPRAARAPLRQEDRRAGRAEGLHDDRPEHAAPRAQSDRRSAQPARRPRLGDRHASTRTTATSRRWPSPRATSSRSTTSPPTATASRARRSRRSTSPTRSRAGVDPNSTFYVSHTLAPGWLPGYPTYEVKTFEGTSLNKSINLVQATLTSDNTVYAQLAADLGEETVTQMAYKMGVMSPPRQLPRRGARRADAGRHAAGNGRRLRDARRRRLAQHADRDHQGRRSPTATSTPTGAQPHRVKVLSDGVTAEETEHPPRERARRHGRRSAINCPTAAKTGTTSKLIDAWLDGYTPNYSTVVWMGYPNKRVVDDRRPRRAPAGRLPARGNLARLHGGGHRRQAVRRIPAAERNRSPTSRSTASTPPPA